MMYYSLPDNLVLPCCKAKLKPPIVYPVRCNCPEPGLLSRIEACSSRGNLTGEEVSCSCPSIANQPIYECSEKGQCIKKPASNVPAGVTVCLGCDVVRND